MSARRGGGGDTRACRRGAPPGHGRTWARRARGHRWEPGGRLPWDRHCGACRICAHPRPPGRRSAGGLCDDHRHPAGHPLGGHALPTRSERLGHGRRAPPPAVHPRRRRLAAARAHHGRRTGITPRRCTGPSLRVREGILNTTPGTRAVRPPTRGPSHRPGGQGLGGTAQAPDGGCAGTEPPALRGALPAGPTQAVREGGGLLRADAAKTAQGIHILVDGGGIHQLLPRGPQFAVHAPQQTAVVGIAGGARRARQTGRLLAHPRQPAQAPTPRAIDATRPQGTGHHTRHPAHPTVTAPLRAAWDSLAVMIMDMGVFDNSGNNFLRQGIGLRLARPPPGGRREACPVRGEAAPCSPVARPEHACYARLEPFRGR